MLKMQSVLNRQQRIRAFEEFEQRLVMSAQALTALGLPTTIDPQTFVEQIEQQAEVTALGHISAQPEIGDAHEQFGLDGRGQTIAVIDSGIAWDHYALGGGYGSEHRVVGGWDFAENDADPYDDGPAGYHGTHVAGIIGSSEATNPGVSPGADLVALRVFDDAGNGNLDWVEDALAWVHQHRNDFQYPITTVNLSLGTDWNAETVPDWGNLEDEFAQLKADGIFISVAAGNAFESYQTDGLSYPAASQHVVPVASHDANGNLSEFSQRDDGVLVAPGESIRSTVPGYLLGTSATNRFLGSTGTSMAAPYVAGASALLRQANQFMGVDHIDQDLLYQQFLDTANRIEDAATGNTFYRINLNAAIEHVIKDLHGNDWSDATALNTIGQGTQIEGTIGAANDRDVFSFRATQSGTMTFAIENTHDLDPKITFRNVQPTLEGDLIRFEVTAGKEYGFSISTENGIGHYKVSVDHSPSVPAKNWGTVNTGQFNEAVNGEGVFKLTAKYDGFLTVRTQLDSAQPMSVTVFDSEMNAISTQTTADGRIRINTHAVAGATYYVQAEGANGLVRFDVSNVVSLVDGELTIRGTDDADSIEITQSDRWVINVDGLYYQFQLDQLDSISLAGHAGDDSLTITLGEGHDQLFVRHNAASITSADTRIIASGFEFLDVDTGGGRDNVRLLGSQGDDHFVFQDAKATWSAEQLRTNLSGFEQLTVMASGGNDYAELTGSTGNDRFGFRNHSGFLRSQDATVSLFDFEQLSFHGGGGKDIANLFDTSGDDEFRLNRHNASVTAESFRVWVNRVSRINAVSSAGLDSVILHDSKLDDNFLSNSRSATMSSADYLNVAKGFTEIIAYAGNGYDTAQISDSALNDRLTSYTNRTVLENSIQHVTAQFFDRVNVVASAGGVDSAELHGTIGNDAVYADGNSSTLTDQWDHIRRVVGFENVEIDGRGGVDSAFLSGSHGNDRFTVDQTRVRFESAMQDLGLTQIDNTKLTGNGGVDEAIFEDFDQLDLLSALGDKAVAYLAKHTVSAIDIDILNAQAKAGANPNYDIDAVDFLYMLGGRWKETT